MMVKFAVNKCEQCGANLSNRKPKSVVEVKPHPGEPDIEERSYAPCPKCGAGVPIVEEPEAASELGSEEPGRPEEPD